MSKENYTYILRCGDGSLYTGWTTDLAQRVRAHNSGKGAKYTRARIPVELVYWEAFDTKEEAMRRECAIKKLRREQKEALTASMPAETAVPESVEPVGNSGKPVGAGGGSDGAPQRNKKDG